jgi:outer membrane protein TolC
VFLPHGQERLRGDETLLDQAWDDGPLTHLVVVALREGAALRRAGDDVVEADLLLGPELQDAEGEARSPEALQARANQAASEAAVRSLRGSYLPSVDLFGSVSAFDESFFPTATSRSSIGIRASFPIWNNAAREINLSLATSNRDVQRALTTDIELALRRDVVQAYEAYQAATAAAELESQSVIVALENLRVQEQRYQAGPTTIIDLITAQVSLSEAEAELVQARYTTRLALSGLEAILGRRLF